MLASVRKGFRAGFAQHLRETGGEIGAYVGKVARFAEMNLYCHETVFQRHIEHACAGYESFQLVEKVGMRVGAQVREEYLRFGHSRLECI